MALWRLVLVCALVLVMLPRGVMASCDPVTLSEQEARADVIVDATVLEIRTPEPGGASEIVLQVDHVIKGDPGPLLVLRASPPPAVSTTEVPFHEGWIYWRLFLREVQPGSRFFATSTCDGSHELPTPGAEAQPETISAPLESGD